MQKSKAGEQYINLPPSLRNDNSGFFLFGIGTCLFFMILTSVAWFTGRGDFEFLLFGGCCVGIVVIIVKSRKNRILSDGIYLKFQSHHFGIMLENRYRWSDIEAIRIDEVKQISLKIDLNNSTGTELSYSSLDDLRAVEKELNSLLASMRTPSTPDPKSMRRPQPLSFASPPTKANIPSTSNQLMAARPPHEQPKESPLIPTLPRVDVYRPNLQTAVHFLQHYAWLFIIFASMANRNANRQGTDYWIYILLLVASVAALSANIYYFISMRFRIEFSDDAIVLTKTSFFSTKEQRVIWKDLKSAKVKSLVGRSGTVYGYFVEFSGARFRIDFAKGVDEHHARAIQRNCSVSLGEKINFQSSPKEPE